MFEQTKNGLYPAPSNKLIMNENLYQFLNSVYPISANLKMELEKRLVEKEVKKKEFLLQEGEVCNNIYFIESGFFKSFHLREGKEIVQWFMKTNDVIISVNSFYNQVASYEFIQATEDAVVHYISYESLQYLYKNFIEFNFTGRQLTQHYYALSEQRLYGMRKQNAEERYNFLLNTHPEIIQNASRTDIASYLGISLETLSRMKKKK
jgi:CRP/FNR family transcriptional regulator, anaerobic regulatory protein